MATVQFYTKNLVGSFSQLSTSAKNSAVGIFSLKALFVSPARVLNVRNGTNSSTSDIYADVNGNLTTLSGQTLSAWLAGATGYITIWYDQSPVGNHATQVVQASQPIIDFANNQVDFKTAAWFDLPNGTVPSGNSNYTMTFKNNTMGSTQAAIIHSGTQGTQNFVNSIENNSNNYLNFWWGNDIGGGAYAAGTIFTAKYNNTIGRTMYKNGTQTNSDTQTTRSSTTINNFIAKDPRSYYLNGELYYICLFNTALSDADRSIVENQPVAPLAPSIPMSMTIGPPSIPGLIFYVTPLYPFTTFTFTNAGATGAVGPTSLAAYSTTYPGYGTPYALTLGTSLKTGMQLWTVPLKGLYQITAAGAGLPTGPTGASYGIQVRSTYRFTNGQIITLLVGQQGTQNSAYGGCGGSYVVDSSNNPIIIAGGAGGAGSGQSSGTPALITTQSNYSDGFPALRNDNGGGGPVLDQTGGYCEAGGGGFNTGTYSSGTPTGGNGQGTVWSSIAGGLSFLNGGTGGPYGGFGGGGGIGSQFAGGGGGGGYSGGGGGATAGSGAGGGGGGSYGTTTLYSGTSITSPGTNTGQGYITILYLSP